MFQQPNSTVCIAAILTLVKENFKNKLCQDSQWHGLQT